MQTLRMRPACFETGELRFKRGTLLFFLCLLSAAISESAVVPGAPAQWLCDSGETAWHAQRWDEALTRFKDAADKFPDDPSGIEAQCHYAGALSYVAPPEAAIVEYQKVIRRVPGSFEAHEAKCGIAALRFWLGQNQEAFDLFKEVATETKDWATLKECVTRMKQIEHLINLEKHQPEALARDCGPKALIELCEVLGVEVTEKESTRLLPVGKYGVSLEAMRAAARAKGIRLVGAKLNMGQLQPTAKPFIAHLRNNHYLVIKSVQGNRVDYIDPHGRETYTTTNRFYVLWDGASLIPEKSTASLKRSQLLSRAEMKKIYGGHHLHGNQTGGSEENPAAAYDQGGNGGNSCNGCSCAGLPTWEVNLANFNFLIRDLVFSYAGRGPVVELRLTYDADSSRVSGFGRSWTHNFNVVLANESPDGVDIHRGGGKVDHFVTRGNGTFDPPRWNHDELRKDINSGTFTLKNKRTRETQFFNAQGQLTRIEDHNGNAVTLQYNANGLRTVTDAAGRITTFNYNSAGLISEVIDPLGRRATWQYDASSNLVTYVDMNTNVISYTYDAVSYLTSFTTPSGTWQVRRGTTPNFTELPYILREIINPLGYSRRYDTGPTIAWFDDWRNNRFFVYSEGQGETTKFIDAEGATTKRTFSSAGDLASVTDANGRTTTLTHDTRGNLTSIEDNLGNTARFTYDARDNLIRLVDPQNRTNRFTYDGNDNLTQFLDPKGGVTTLVYDGFGQLVSLADPRTNIVRFGYNQNGDLLVMTNALGGVYGYPRDPIGRVLFSVDPKQQFFRYTYDALDRPTGVELWGTPMREYRYECCHLTSITDTNGTLGFAYDAAGRLTRFTNTFGHVIQYQRDPNGNVTNLVYPDGKSARYAFDRANRMTRVTDWLGNTTAYSYDPAGNLLLSTNSNGTMARYQYDSANRLVNLINARTDGSVIAAYRLAMDALGNRTNVTVVSALPPALASTNVTAAYEADNRILVSADSTFTHDTNGNLTAISGPKPTTFEYDIFNRLTRVAFTNYTAEHQYDAMGNRIARTVNGTTKKYVTDIGGPLSRLLTETDAAGNTTANYVYGLGLISKVSPGNQTYLYHFDALGSTVAMTDSYGITANKYAYDPFGGKLVNSIETSANAFAFVGQAGVMDEANGLHFMRARFYHAKEGRFINKDPLGLAGGLNAYAYAGGDPLNLADPSGLLTVAFYRSCDSMGEYQPETDTIYLHMDLSPLDLASTFVHELTHKLLPGVHGIAVGHQAENIFNTLVFGRIFWNKLLLI